MGARIFAYCFLGAFTIGSLVSLTISAGSVAQRVWLILAGSHADGTVVALRQSPQRNHGAYAYAPVVQFTAGDGQTYVLTSDVSGAESKYRFGQHLQVLYPPSHPDGARLDAFAPMWTLPLVTGIVGTAFSVVPAIVITSWRRRRRAATGESLPGEPDSMPGSGLRRVLGIFLTAGGLVLAGVSLASPDSAAADSALEAKILGTSVGVMLAASGVQVGGWVTTGSRTHYALGALVVSSMALIFGWIAFFGHASGFSAGVGVSGASVGLRGGVTVARLAFGAFSIFAGAVSLWTWSQVLRRGNRSR